MAAEGGGGGGGEGVDIRRSAIELDVEVSSPCTRYSESFIDADYTYESVDAVVEGGKLKLTPKKEELAFRTERKVPKVGLMMVGWGGNNGTTLTAAITAHRKGLVWHSREGEHRPDWFGSVTQSATTRVGSYGGRDVFSPLHRLAPMVQPTDLVLGGWDISGMPLGDAMVRAKVLPYDLQRQLVDELNHLKPLPAPFDESFVASNQAERADNVLDGGKEEQVAAIRSHIRAFREENKLDKVIVLWTATTERYCEVKEEVHGSAESLLAAIASNHPEIPPSQLFAVASVQEHCAFINGSPQNTFVPGIIELARSNGVFVAGDDFKSGQTKLKSALVDFLVNAGIKPEAIVSYNHLGNNDGRNLSAAPQFRSKEISKSTVVDDMVEANPILYPDPSKDHPDHTVVIKYVPSVGDSKRALDEYVCRIFMGGLQTISLYNQCEDSLLAAPIILDLVILTEFFQRVTVRRSPTGPYSSLDSILSLLSYLLKAPLVKEETPVVNSLYRQREALTNVLRACVGLPPESHMLLEHKM